MSEPAAVCVARDLPVAVSALRRADRNGGLVRRLVDDPAGGDLLYRAVFAVVVLVGVAALALSATNGWVTAVSVMVSVPAAVVAVCRVAALYEYCRFGAVIAIEGAAQGGDGCDGRAAG